MNKQARISKGERKLYREIRAVKRLRIHKGKPSKKKTCELVLRTERS